MSQGYTEPSVQQPFQATPEMAQGQTQDVEKEVTEQRKALVKEILENVLDAKKHWKRDYDRMREDIYFAEGNHWVDTIPGLTDDRLIVDITTRHIQLRTAALYAKNPTVVARRREQLDFTIWDEDINTLMAAVQRSNPANGVIATPEQAAADAALLQDARDGMMRRNMFDRIGRTLEIIFRYSLKQQQPAFKTCLKDLIPRTLTTGVGYIKPQYQRVMQKRPETEHKLMDATNALAGIEASLKLVQGAGEDEHKPEREVLALQMKALQNVEELVLQEGLVFSYPESTAIIPDKKCKNLVGFQCSDWVAEEFCLSPRDIQETWKVDIGKKYTKYYAQADGQVLKVQTETEKEHKAAVYVVYNIRTSLVYVVCDGYEDFLVEPAPPQDQIESFWPWFALVFTRRESGRSPFPKSDVRLLMPLQREINRLMEALRQHRIASRPLYVHDASAFDNEDKIDFSVLPPHMSIALKALAEGRKVEDVIAPLKRVNIDPNIYTAEPIYDAISKVIGAQEANFGSAQGSANGSATEASIAETSRISALASNTDDLDDMLTAVARACGQVLFREMSKERAMKIAGPGGLWPELSGQDIAEEVFLEVEAGSTGRPNRAQDIANFERMAPFMIQMPGMSAKKMIEYMWRILDDRVSVADFYDPNALSIVAQNAGAQPSTGNTETDPNAQGARGGRNQENNDQSTGGPQPAYPQQPEGAR